MQNENGNVTREMNFFEGNCPLQLIEAYGSPIYVYNERIFRERINEMKNLSDYPNFVVNYSAKANSNIHLLKIVHEMGLHVDAMSPGEIFTEEMAGFSADEIFYIGNNVSAEEMRYAADRGIVCSIDSISQLITFGKANPGRRVSIRFNSGIGVGHHEKVVTAGKKTKFGVNPEDIPQAKQVLVDYNLRLVGINHHIGSLFMEGETYVMAAKALLEIATQFDDLEFVDIGGGFGIPYKKSENQARLDLSILGQRLTQTFESFAKSYGKQLTFMIEPGRYIPAESCVLLGTVHAVKQNGGVRYIGSDIGFNVLQRPVLYDAYHDIEVYHRNKESSPMTIENVTIVGNICETGDILTKDRALPKMSEGDGLGVLDAGAYGYCMASNYNNRLRPAEILLDLTCQPRIIRRRDTFEDLVANMSL